MSRKSPRFSLLKDLMEFNPERHRQEMYSAQRKYVAYLLINYSIPNCSNLMMALSRWTSSAINSLPPHKTPHIAIPSSWHPHLQLTKPFQVLAMLNLWLLQDHPPLRNQWLASVFYINSRSIVNANSKAIMQLIDCLYLTLVHPRQTSHADCLVANL